MRSEQEVRARREELAEELRQVVDGEESFGETDAEEIEKLELRIVELDWMLGV